MRFVIMIFSFLMFFNIGIAQTHQPNIEPSIIRPVSHDSNYKSTHPKTSSKSFYQSKGRWQAIIDSTWGPGLPLNQKLNIFDTYTRALTESFDGFKSLGINEEQWENMKSSSRSTITVSTSRGAFSAIMGHLAYDLKDFHTSAWDDTVVYTPLNPGVPILVIGDHTIGHFGAVLTPLTDSTLVVLRTIENHPLGLEPGDIVLGYEGVPWKQLFDELMDANLPILYIPRGAPSAIRHFELYSAGMNWHLFESIDIKKYATKEIINLSVAPLIDLPATFGDMSSSMFNNEQLPVPGVILPDATHFNDRGVNYGIIEGTNIGYIYLFHQRRKGVDYPLPGYEPINYNVESQFYEAVSNLFETDALIIDIRLNFGGGLQFYSSLELLFSEIHHTITNSKRCNSSDFSLCKWGDDKWDIPGKAGSLFDRPIAVLLGPYCQSWGNVTAQRLRYHPMTHFFGKSSGASLGLCGPIEYISGWTLRYSGSDFFHLNEPDTYLNRTEFPIDVPVWFDVDDVAKGEDTVVKSAVEWIRNLSYAHDVKVNLSFANPNVDTLAITTIVENPNQHDLTVQGYISYDDTVIVDSCQFFNDGNHNDGVAGDSNWGALNLPVDEEHFYQISVKTEDHSSGTFRTITNAAIFTSVGPVVCDSYTITSDDTIHKPGDTIKFKLALKNKSTTVTVPNVNAQISTLDSFSVVTRDDVYFGNLGPGESKMHSLVYYETKVNEGISSSEVSFMVTISSDGYPFWCDTLSIPLIETKVMENGNNIPTEYALSQNYPNPFNPTTTIEYDLPNSENIKITIYDVLGRQVKTLVDSKLQSGHFQTAWDGTNEFNAHVAAGIYLCHMETENYIKVIKLALVK